MPPEEVLPPGVRDWIARSMAMQSLTRDELVNRLWEFSSDDQTELYFVLQGRFEWKSPHPERHDVLLGVLASENADPPGSGYASLLKEMPHDYGLTVPVSRLDRGDPDTSRQAILDGFIRMGYRWRL